MPFQWDDQVLIAENTIIKNPGFFLEPSAAKGNSYYGIFRRRYVSMLTFALNYKINGLDVRGYHIFNLTVHLLNSLLVYALVRLTFKSPLLKPSVLLKHGRKLAFFTALFFVAHPVQTEAVTYVMQRFASLVTLFYLLSLVLYIKWRLLMTAGGRRPFEAVPLGYYFLCLFAGLLAMLAKENALTLPFAILLYEALFFSGPLRGRLLRIIPLFMLLVVFLANMKDIGAPLEKVVLGSSNDNIHEEMLKSDRWLPFETGYSRWEYFITQPRVIITYLRLLLLPLNQNLDYDYPLFKSVFDRQPFFSLLFLLALFGVSLYLLSRKRYPDFRLISFGILWFFLTLSVESSILPLPMIIHEYRLYMPGIGIYLAALSAAGLFMESPRMAKKKALLAALIIAAPFFYAAATYERNKIWRSGISLWSDVVRKSPAKARPHQNLGLAYLKEGMNERAANELKIALGIEPDSTLAHANLGTVYRNMGRPGEALEHFEAAVKLDSDRAIAHNNLGTAYRNMGRSSEALEHFQAAVRLDPYYADAHNNLAIAYRSAGRIDDAIAHYEIALGLKPDSHEIHNNAGVAYAAKGLVGRAIEHYEAALRLNPDYAQAHINIGNAYDSEGLSDKAIEHYEAAMRLRPDIPDTYNNLATVYQAKGMLDKATEYYKSAIRLKPDYAEAHFNLADVYSLRGMKDEAREHLKIAFRLRPDLKKTRKE